MLVIGDSYREMILILLGISILTAPIMGLGYWLKTRACYGAVTNPALVNSNQIENIPAIYFKTDPEGRTFSLNPFAASYLGYQSNELTGITFLSLVVVEDHIYVRELFQQCLKQPGIVFEQEFRINHQNGIQYYWMRASAQAIPTTTHADQIAMVCHDISVRKQVELERDLRLKELEVIHKASHNIKHASTIDEMLSLMMNETLSSVKALAGSIWLYDSTEDHLKKMVGHGWLSEINMPPITPGESIVGRVYQDAETYFIREFKTDRRVHPQLRKQAPQGWGGVCIPISVDTFPLGVLVVAVELPREVTPREVNLLILLSEMAGNALQRMRLHNQTLANMRDLGNAYQTLLETWSRALDLRDHETEGHTQRVTEMTMELAHRLKVPDECLSNLYRGAIMHDIGKIGVPDAILLKQDRLTEDEWDIMRQHPQIAYESLRQNPYLKSALDIPYCHHEKWDGTGYPRQLKGTEIPFAARIFAVVDVWDAITSNRPYRKALPAAEALAYIRSQSGIHFDPQIVEVFIEFIEDKLLPPAPIVLDIEVVPHI